ncbi:MAG TPA: threonine synthase [Stellaceae bacterium]|nr:threonine synthase [Stellaceae bacterium]
MPYVSTRDGRPRPERVEFEEVLLRGLAPDGGLYLPDQWPSLSTAALRALRGRPYAEVAARVMGPFLGHAVTPARLAQILAESYADFDQEAVAPLRQIAPDLWLLELFHGPTLAFKDYALQLVGRLFDEVLARRGGRVTIIGATSGDTGSAAIAATRDRATADIFMLYPEGRISDIQRRQMTTVVSANVHAIGIAGSFDDCQDLVKAMFADAPFRAAHNLSAVNSINWARIMAQTVYYVVAALALGAPERRVSFTVPTGNFGNVYAAHVAKRMGLPIERLVVATNRNDILARFFNDGTMSLRPVEPSLSPSMDIQVSSNFERLLFELRGRDGRAVADAMTRFRASGALPVSEGELSQARDEFSAYACDDDATRAEIARTWRRDGILLDPHGAVGMAAARTHMAQNKETGIPMIVLATAHPAKFPDAIEQAIGVRPVLPPRLADVMERPERLVRLKNDITAVKEYVRAHARPQRGVAA